MCIIYHIYNKPGFPHLKRNDKNRIIVPGSQDVREDPAEMSRMVINGRCLAVEQSNKGELVPLETELSTELRVGSLP